MRESATEPEALVVREPARGRYLYFEHPEIMRLSGREQMRFWLKHQDAAAPPLFHMTGIRLVDTGVGTATYRMPATPWLQTGAGVFPAGAFALVADAALGGAIFSALPPGQVLATSELSMNFLRPASTESGHLIARARLIQIGETLALSEAEVEDAHGRLLAHATSRCVVLDVPVPPGDPPDPAVFALPKDDEGGPDPYERPPEGEVVPAAFDKGTGLETLKAWAAGETPSAPVERYLGVRIVEIDRDRVVFAMPASEWWAQGGRVLYGGALALFADFVIGSAVMSTLPAAATYATLDLKTNFLRPVQPDGRELVAVGSIVHRGRSIAVADCEILDADDKRVAIATGTNAILPGRRWEGTRPVEVMDEAPAEEDTGDSG